MGIRQKIANKMMGVQMAAHGGIVQMMKDKCLAEARSKYKERDLPTVEEVVEGLWEVKGVRASLGMVNLGKPDLVEIMEYVIGTLKAEREGEPDGNSREVVQAQG